MRKTAWGVALALAIFIAAWFYRGDSGVSGENGAMNDSRVAHGQSADAVLHIKPGLPMRGGAAGGAKLTPLMQELFSAKGWSDILERLRSATQRTPEESWVLAEILDKCGQVTDRKPPEGPAGFAIKPTGEEARNRFVASISDKDPNRDKRIAAYDRMRIDRCGNIRSSTTTSIAEIDALRQAAAAAGDAKGRIWLARNLPGEAKFEVIKQVMRSGDPFAMETAGFYLAFGTEDFSLRAGPQELPVDNEAFTSAMRLVACDFGRSCGPEAEDMAWSCASRGQCDAHDLREHLFFYRSSPSQSQLIVEYHEALTRAARDGDWSYFTPHRGPAPVAAMFNPPPKPAPSR